METTGALLPTSTSLSSPMSIKLPFAAALALPIETVLPDRLPMEE